MKEFDASSVHIVRTAQAAEALRDPDRLSQIAPFLGRERTVSDVARELGKHPSTVYRRVLRFLELGLLEVAREQHRHGKRVKYYRSVADTFFVPCDLTGGSWSGVWHEFWEKEFDASLEEAWSGELLDWGHQLGRDRFGVLNISLARRPNQPVDPLDSDAPAVMSSSHDALYLDFDDAKRMQRELDEVWKRYMNRRGAQRYLARVLLVPAREGTPKLD